MIPRFGPTYMPEVTAIDHRAVNATTCAQYITAGCIQGEAIIQSLTSHDCADLW